MLQTRAGHCPNCKEEILPGADICPACGHRLDWNHAANAPRPAAVTSVASAPGQRKAVTTHTAIEWLAYLIGAVLLIALALFMRNVFFSGDQAPEVQSPHGVRIRDAERFRDQVTALRSNPQAPEVHMILGSAMPANSDALEITVGNEWLMLDYNTRLRYATLLAERWKGLHAPHRAYFHLLDISGNEIGGRTTTGKVWVVETHGTVRRKTTQPAKAQPKQ